MKRIIAILMVVLLAALACTITPDTGGVEKTLAASAGDLATSVSATLTAVAGGGGVVVPGDTPAAVPTDTPEPPPAPQPLRIAYVDHDNLQLWTEGVGSVMLYTGEKVYNLTISDDGQVIAFETVDSSYMPLGLYRINTDGTNLVQLINAAEFVAMSENPSALGAEIYRMDFAPGSHILTFNTKLIFEGPGLSIQPSIMNVNTDSGLVTTLFTAADPSNFYYSPDGTQIALSDHNSISLINADGTNLRPDVINFPQINTASEYLLFPPPTWAPDSSYLRVVIPSPDPFDPAAFMTVYNIPTDGSPGASIGVFSGLSFFSFQGGDISPDMQTFVYQTQFGPPTDNMYEIHLVNLAGGTDSVYSSGPQTMMVWNPDSQHFVIGRAGSPTLLGRIGAGTMALTDVPTALRVEWVDATRFIFTTGNYSAWQLRLGSLGAASSLIAAPTADSIIFDFSD